jgi:ureidoglycolate lyase
MKNSIPLTPDGYARFGRALSLDAALRGSARSANQGSAQRVDYAAELVNLRPKAKLNVALFRCGARAIPFEAKLLERHAYSSQLFVPMDAGRYLVVVAEGGDAPDLSTLAVFLAEGAQAVSYAPGTWHHPMIALDRAIDFTCLVYEDGTAADCDEFVLPEALLVAP